MWDKRAQVLRVKDGDTLEVMLDQGFGDTKTISIRLLSVWAPETDEPAAEEVSAYVKQWLMEHGWTNSKWPFVVVTMRTRTDREVMSFNRYITVLTSADGTDSLNADLVSYLTR